MRIIPCLTVHQPWAMLMFYRLKPKDVENRSWPCHYRGPLAIHAGKKFDQDAVDWIADEIGVYLTPLDCQFGAIIGVVDLVDCVQGKSGSPWSFGPVSWVLANPRACEPVYCAGKQGLWSTDLDALKLK